MKFLTQGQKKDSGNRRQGGGGWGTPLKKRSATRIKIERTVINSVDLGKNVLFEQTSLSVPLRRGRIRKLSAERGRRNRQKIHPAQNQRPDWFEKRF